MQKVAYYWFTITFATNITFTNQVVLQIAFDVFTDMYSVVQLWTDVRTDKYILPKSLPFSVQKIDNNIKAHFY